MSTLLVQNDFTHGELAPKLLARSDIVLYRKAARQMRNVVVLPGGGAKRRFGLEFVNDQTDLTHTQWKMHSFDLTEEKSYLLIFTTEQIKIYLDGALVATVPTPYIDTAINLLKMSQTTNRLIVAHPNFQPRELIRGPDDTIWTFEAMVFSFVPFHDFVSGSYDDNQFLLSGVNIGTHELTIQGSGSFVFTEAYVGGAFFANGSSISNPLGYARIVAFNSPTSVDAKVIIAFDTNSNPFDGKDSIVAEKGWGDLESDGSGDRGWPISCTFYQDRLYFGGSRSLPQTIFASRVNDFVDFDIGTGEDDEAIIATLGGNTINNIKHIIADRSLQLFTFSSEWTPPQLEDSPLTPGNISMKKQTNEGATDTDPVILDNFTFYVKRGGRGVMAYRFDIDNESYNSTNASIISQNLIVNPIDSTVLKGSIFEDANYLMLVNEDGTLAVFQTLAEQDVSAWTLADTDGSFIRCQEVGDQVYFLIKRTIEGEERLYLERLNFDIYTDSQSTFTFGSPTSFITGLNHLEGKTVKVRGDRFVQPDQVVVNGEITLDEAATFVEVGLNYTPLIEMLPVIVQSQQGPTNYIPKRINRIFVQFFETLGTYVNGEMLIPNLQFNDVFTPDTLEPSAEPQTGSFQLYNEGWYVSPKGRVSDKSPKTITITQFDPLPMNILAVGYEVTV